MSDAPMFRFRGSAPPTAASRASVLEADAASETGIAEIYLYDPIDSWGGWWGVSAKEFADALGQLPAGTSEIRLHINSPGGDVWEMFAMINLLRQHAARVVAIVDGLAASAASVIAITADECVMGVGAQMMIHDASTIAWGNEAALLKQASLLGRDSDVIASLYAKKSGGDAADWRALMRDETWFYGTEAVAAGLADRSEDGGDEPSTATTAVLVGARYASRAEAPAPRITDRLRADPQPPVSPEPGNTNRKEDDVDHTEFLTGLRTRLGVQDAAASEETILAALDESLAEQAATNATLPEGVVAIEQGVLDALRTDAAAGRTARDELDAQRRDGIVDAALRAGKITAAQRESWRTSLNTNEIGTKALLDGLAAGAVPVEAKAAGATEDGVSAEDALFNSIYAKEA